MLKKRRLLISIIFVLFSLVWGIGYYANRDLSVILQEKINSAISGNLTWEKLHISLLRGKIEAEGATLKDTEHNKVASASRAVVKISWTSLLKQHLIVKEFIVEKPWIDLRTGTDGRLNLISALTSPDTSQDKEPSKRAGILTNLRIKGFKISNGTVDYLVSEKGHSLSIDNIDLYGSLWTDCIASENDIPRRSFSINSKINFSLKNFRTKRTTSPMHVSLAATACFQKDIVRLDYLEAKMNEAILQSNGSYNRSSKNISAKISLHTKNISNILSLLGIEEVKGNLGIEATAIGTLKQPRFDLVLNADNLCYKKTTLGNVHGNAVLDKSGNIEISRLVLQNKNSSLLATGSIHVLQQQIKMGLTGKNIWLEDFTSGKKGRFSLNAQVDGSIKQPRGVLTVYGQDIEFGGQRFQTLTLFANIEGEKIWMKPLRLTVKQGESIEAHGWVSLKRQYQIALTSEGITLNSINRFKKQGIKEGKILFRLTGNGTLGDPKLKGQIWVKNMDVGGQPFDAFQINIDLHDQIVHANGRFNFAFDGLYHLKNKDFSANMKFDHTDLSPYFKIADKSDLSGFLSGKIHANGNMHDLKKMQALADISLLEIFIKGTEAIYTKKISCSLHDRRISVPPSRLRLFQDGWIDIEGNSNLDGPLSFTANGHVPVHLLSLFTESLSDIDGDIIVSAKIKGTRARPDIQATIDLNNAGFTLGNFQRVHDTNGLIRIAHQNIMIDSIKGNFDTGKFDIKGNIGLKKFTPSDLSIKINAEALPLKVNDTFDTLLNARINISGKKERPIAKGEIVLIEGVYYRDVKLRIIEGILPITLDEILPGKKTREPKRSGKKWPILGKTDIDIVFKSRNHVLIDNNLARLKIKPDLNISGKFYHPIIVGQAKVESGTVTYQRKTFLVTRGVIDFLNPYTTEATFDIRGVTQIHDWKIFLTISGPANNLTFDLSSDPPEEDGDILSLLVLGKTTRELAKGEKGASTSTSQMLAEIIANTFGEEIKKTTGLDILELEKVSPEETESETMRLLLGKELSRRMMLKYAIDSKSGQMSRRAIAEYKALENILFAGFQDSKGIYGAEVQFRLEFR